MEPLECLATLYIPLYKEWLDILEVSSEAVRIVSGALRLEVSHTPKRDLQP